MTRSSRSQQQAKESRSFFSSSSVSRLPLPRRRGVGFPKTYCFRSVQPRCRPVPHTCKAPISQPCVNRSKRAACLAWWDGFRARRGRRTRLHHRSEEDIISLPSCIQASKHSSHHPHRQHPTTAPPPPTTTKWGSEASRYMRKGPIVVWFGFLAPNERGGRVVHARSRSPPDALGHPFTPHPCR